MVSSKIALHETAHYTVSSEYKQLKDLCMFRLNAAREIQAWLSARLAEIPANARILDAGAGELKNREFCKHLEYVSQDFCQYAGDQDEAYSNVGLQNETWDTSKIDIVSDITSIPEAEDSFDVVMCSEVLEHVPSPELAIKEFARLLKPGGKLLITAPFASFVHMAPYHFSSGFSRYWYEHHLPANGFRVLELKPNGDWFAFLQQEAGRLGYMERRSGNWRWPLAYLFSLLMLLYMKVRGNKTDSEFACLGWFCLAEKL